MLDLCLVIIPCGVVGARLYYVLFELKQYLSNPIRMLYIWEGGLAIYGAVIGGLLGLLIYTRVKKMRFLKLADCIAPGLILAQAIGRWGNFFNQEAYGAPITNPKLWWFPFAVYIENSPLEHPFITPRSFTNPCGASLYSCSCGSIFVSVPNTTATCCLPTPFCTALSVCS